MVELYRREEKKKKEVQVKAAYAVEQASWPPRAGSNHWMPLDFLGEAPPLKVWFVSKPESRGPGGENTNPVHKMEVKHLFSRSQTVGRAKQRRHEPPLWDSWLTQTQGCPSLEVLTPLAEKFCILPLGS